VLADIPDGADCFIDATIFYYHLVHTPHLSDDCSDFLRRVELKRVRGHTTPIAVSEATHKVMFAEIVQRHAVDHKGLVARIKRHPELLDGLADHKMVSATVRALDVRVEAVTLDVLARAAELSSQERLLTNDALTLAVMETTNLTCLATNDDDFDSVSAITVFKPARR